MTDVAVSHQPPSSADDTRSSISIWSDELMRHSTLNDTLYLQQRASGIDITPISTDTQQRTPLLSRNDILSDVNTYVTPVDSSDLFALTHRRDSMLGSIVEQMSVPEVSRQPSRRRNLSDGDKQYTALPQSVSTDSICIDVDTCSKTELTQPAVDNRRHTADNTRPMNITIDFNTDSKHSASSTTATTPYPTTAGADRMTYKQPYVHSKQNSRNNSVIREARPLSMNRFTSFSIHTTQPNLSSDASLSPVSPVKLMHTKNLLQRGNTFLTHRSNGLSKSVNGSSTSIDSNTYCKYDDKELPPLRTSATLRATPRWFVQPNGYLRFIWNTVVVVCILCTAVEVPLQLAFAYDSTGFVYGLDVCIDVFFILDIAINLCTGYHDKHLVLVTSFPLIAKRYLRTWFVVDLVGSVPLDLMSIGLNPSSNNKLLSVFRILKLPRLFRIARLVNLLHIRTHHLLNEGIRMLKLIMFMYITAHWVACGFFLIGRLEATGYISSLPAVGNSLSRDTVAQASNWIVNVYPDTTMSQQYVYSVYWSFTVLATVGFGDVVPVTVFEMVYTVCVMIVGAIMYAAIVGNVMLTLNNLNATSQQHSAAIMKFANYMRYREFPPHLTARVLDYTEAEWKRMRGHDEHEMIATLPVALQTDISRHLHGKLIEQVGSFKDCHVGFINALALALQSAVMLPNTLLTRKGQPGTCMYFISSGAVELIDGGQVYAVLTEGSYVGESALLDGLYRVTARTSTYCELCVLSRQDFEAITINYPEFIDIIKTQQEQTLKMESRKDKLKALFAE